MKTILVLATHPAVADDLRGILDPGRYRVVHRLSTDDAEPLLAHGLAQVCVIDGELVDTQGLWLFDKIRRRLPGAPIIVLAEEGPWPIEEEVYLAGVKHVLRKPLRPRILEAVLEQGGAGGSSSRPAAPATRAAVTPAAIGLPSRPANETNLRVLQSWREFSRLLPNSLDTDALLKQFLLRLREITGVNRAAVFLRPPVVSGAGQAVQAARFLRAVSVLGLSGGALNEVELSLETGVGGYLHHSGRILWRDSAEAQGDSEIEREFSLLGAQVVVPILAQQSMVGLVAFDARVTGEPLTREELELIFHMLEEIGGSVRNIWFHEQLAASQQMLSGVLRQFNSGCIVVGRELEILHCNDSGRRFLGSKREVDIAFSDLPVVLGGKVYQVLKSGAALAPFRFQPADGSKSVFQISIVPLQSRAGAPPDSALMVVEERTQTEQLHHLEVEAENLRLIKSMADRLAHEIGNALVPVSTHQQLLSDQYLDPDFRASLDVALSDGVKRISRLVNQMRFLSRDSVVAEASFPLRPVVEEAFADAQAYQPIKSALLKFDDGIQQPSIVAGDRAALKHAFLEVFLNALQANPSDARIAVRLKPAPGFNGQGKRWVQVEVQDNGPGFSPEASGRVPSPFFTTRTVGLGLGLTVSRKIVETHHGKLEILKPGEVEHGVVRILLPQNGAAA